MVFSAPIFLFVFLPAVLAALYITPARRRNLVTLIASLCFYGWAEPIFIFVVFASALLDWLLGRIIHERGGHSARACVTLSVATNIGILAYVKYANFFVENFDAVLRRLHVHGFELAAIALPVGISFIVFEKITYTVDIYRGIRKPAASLLSYLLYVFLFPKLLAGPIIKYHDIADQLAERSVTLVDIEYGLWRFAKGLAKKALIADTLARPVQAIFAMPSYDLGFHNAWFGLLSFTMQIFFDFSGYSDMAIGLARLLGFRIPENFNSPYISQSFTEFWRRWHISLSTWIREYLYFPLGGNRVSTGRTYFNLWVCFLLSGLWHGARWTFVIWGAYQGLFLVLDKLFWLKVSKQLPGVLNTVLCFVLIVFGWVIFRSTTIGQAGYYMQTLLGLSTAAGKFIWIPNDVKAALACGFALSFLPMLRLPATWTTRPWLTEIARPPLTFATLLISLSHAVNSTFNPFLYFRF